MHPHEHEDLRKRVAKVGGSCPMVGKSSPYCLFLKKRMLMELVALDFPQVEAADKIFHRQISFTTPCQQKM